MKSVTEITEWLKEHKLYEKFRVNYNKARHSFSFTEFMMKFLSKHIVSLAFVWHDTKEGNEYWNRINNKYLKWHDET